MAKSRNTEKENQVTNETETAQTETASNGDEASITARALATVAAPGALPNGFVLAKQVTRPLLKHPDNTTVYVRILSEVYQGKEIKGSQMAPAEMVNVHNLESGGTMEYQYIVSAVTKGILTEEFPDKSYVGKCFAIHALPKEKGKRYRTFSIIEIKEQSA